MWQDPQKRDCYISQIKKLILPPPPLKVSQWADQYRLLTGPSVAEPGPWKTARAEYQRGVMDVCNDPEIETIVLMFSTQVGKTEILLNILGYYLDADPGPSLVILPTEDTAREWSKDRLNPLLAAPVFKEKSVFESETQEKSTILQKRVNGATLSVAFSSSAAQLASRPIRILLCDEVDRYQPDAGGEGDPINLAIKRTAVFWNRKVILASSPGRKGSSRIEQAYQQSDQRRYYVPCSSCGTFQHLKWAQVVWEDHQPETAKYQCEHCQILLTNKEIKAAIPQGEWKATGPKGKCAGFHLNELYSPWKSLSQVVADFLEAKKSPLTLKTFVNTSLAEVWEEKGFQVEPDPLYQRREDYQKIPMEGLVVVCGVDVQKHWLAGEVVAYGKGEESWSLEYFEIPGNPTKSELWEQLEEKLLQRYPHEAGIELEIVATCIDRRHFSDYVYAFCQNKEYRRVFPVHGLKTPGGPILGKGHYLSNKMVWDYPVGTDTAKRLIYSRLQMKEPGEGYMHFPLEYTLDYFKQLTGEELRSKYVRGFETSNWVKTRRNEALDCRVYSLAALHILNPHYERIQKKLIQLQSQNPIKTFENMIAEVAWKNFMKKL